MDAAQSTGFVFFDCDVCGRKKAEVRDHRDVTAQRLGQYLLVCRECTRAKAEAEEDSR
jgi:hypothetical protein